MCGIAGIIDARKQSSLSILKNMTDVLQHRGPNDSGYFFEQHEDFQIGLGHRRLSILDLSSHGHQPIHFENLTMIYNGEVYNYKEIRSELEFYGYVFESNSDTEVILKAYHKWGVSCISRFNGMFSIAIFDSNKNNVTLIRDRSGVKPLYFFYKDGLFMFASELKSFHAHANFCKDIDPESVSLFFRLGYIPQPRSIFKFSHKLTPGHYLTFDLTSFAYEISKYWDLYDSYNAEKIDISQSEAILHTEKLLISACSYRMVSDVPVGVFLSGGYDSSAVVSLLQTNMTKKLKTFSIGFEEPKFNEAQHAKKVANFLGTEHTEYYCNQSDALNIVQLLPKVWDEPFGDPSTIPTMLVSKLARQSVGVSLSADGGDEIFGGYDKYYAAVSLHNFKRSLPFSNQLGSFLSSYKTGSLSLLNKIPKLEHRMQKVGEALTSESCIETLTSIGAYFSRHDLQLIMREYYGDSSFIQSSASGLNDNLDPLEKMMAFDYVTYQSDDILTKVDRATMYYSLEGREPFLDYNLIEYVSRLKPEVKFKRGVRKHLLKEIVHKYLPKEMMDRPKMGFSVPIYSWLRTELRGLVEYYLSEQSLSRSGLFNVGIIVSMRDRFLEGYDVNANQIWLLVTFQMWFEEWCVNNKSFGTATIE